MAVGTVFELLNGVRFTVGLFPTRYVHYGLL